MKKPKILVTAGNTRIPIDRVRGIDNIFKGRTGVAIARYFAENGCEVTLLTSHPDLALAHHNLKTMRFNSYDSLFLIMEKEIRSNAYDVVIHSAAVSDYYVSGTYIQSAESLVEIHNSGKISSDHTELWLKLTPTMKIVDYIRDPWGFRGILVKFKLQVGMSDEDLIVVSTKSMKHSKADFVVANTLEGMNQKASIISNKREGYVSTGRSHLPSKLFGEIFI